MTARAALRTYRTGIKAATRPDGTINPADLLRLVDALAALLPPKPRKKKVATRSRVR